MFVPTSFEATASCFALLFPHVLHQHWLPGPSWSCSSNADCEHHHQKHSWTTTGYNIKTLSMLWCEKIKLLFQETVEVKMLRFTYVLCIALTKRNDSACTCCTCTPTCPSIPTYQHTHTHLHFHVIHTQQRHFSLLKGRDTARVLVFCGFGHEHLFLFCFFCHGGEKDALTHRSLAMTVFRLPSNNKRQLNIDNAHRWGSLTTKQVAW